jgi:hypothetical protein
MILSGAMSANVTAATQGPTSGCHVQAGSLLGEVDFGSDSNAFVLRFQGVPGTTTLPLPGLSTPGPKFVTLDVAGGASEWGASVGQPTSSGTMMLSTGGTTAIHGSVDASLSPLRGSSTPLHMVVSWIC